MTDSRRKGVSGEREFAKAVHDQFGVTLRRNLDQVRSGGHDLIVDTESTGIVAHWLADHAIEIKRYRSVTPALITQWWAQTTTQATKASLRPMLAYRADRQSWRVVLSLGELVPDAGGVFTVDLESLAVIAGRR